MCLALLGCLEHDENSMTFANKRKQWNAETIKHYLTLTATFRLPHDYVHPVHQLAHNKSGLD